MRGAGLLARGLETVTVLTPVEGAADPFGAPNLSYTEQDVGCLVYEAGTDDVTDTNRPDGTKAVYGVHFPKGFDQSLRGCRLRIRGEVFDVEGDPRPHVEALTPGLFGRRATAVEVMG